MREKRNHTEQTDWTLKEKTAGAIGIAWIMVGWLLLARMTTLAAAAIGDPPAAIRVIGEWWTLPIIFLEDLMALDTLIVTVLWAMMAAPVILLMAAVGDREVSR